MDAVMFFVGRFPFFNPDGSLPCVFACVYVWCRRRVLWQRIASVVSLPLT